MSPLTKPDRSWTSRMAPVGIIAGVLAAAGSLIAAAGSAGDAHAQRSQSNGPPHVAPVAKATAPALALRPTVTEPMPGRILSISRTALDLRRIGPGAFGD